MHDVVGSREDGALLGRYADVLAVVHVSRYYYLAGGSASSSSSSSSSSSTSKSAGTGAAAPASSSAAAVPVPPMEALYDDSGKVAEAFGLLATPAKQQPGGAALDCLFLIRPDGYVGVRAVGWGLQPVLAYLDALFPGRQQRSK